MRIVDVADEVPEKGSGGDRKKSLREDGVTAER